MNTRELYFKAYMMTNKQEIMLYYTRLNDDLLECLEATNWLTMNKAKHEDNIAYLQEIEKRKGFMFWNISEECTKWLESKSGEQQKLISTFVMEQR